MNAFSCALVGAIVTCCTSVRQELAIHLIAAFPLGTRMQGLVWQALNRARLYTRAWECDSACARVCARLVDLLHLDLLLLQGSQGAVLLGLIHAGPRGLLPQHLRMCMIQISSRVFNAKQCPADRTKRATATTSC